MTLIFTAFAWLLNNWKVALAGLAVAALVGFGLYKDRAGYQRRVNEEAAAQVQVLQDRLNTVNAINSAYGKRYAADQKALSELKKAASETPKNDGPCLPRDAAGRVRSIR